MIGKSVILREMPCGCQLSILDYVEGRKVLSMSFISFQALFSSKQFCTADWVVDFVGGFSPNTHDKSVDLSLLPFA
jgi:hypothetical protein